jgi:hypothetical protein
VGVNSTTLKREENSRLDPTCRNFHGRAVGHIIFVIVGSHTLKFGNR